MYDAVQKVSKSFLRRYALLKFQTLAKLITLIINSFYSMLCRGVLQTPAQQTPAQQTPAQQTPAQQTPAQQTPTQQTPTQLKTEKYCVIAKFSPTPHLLTSII